MKGGYERKGSSDQLPPDATDSRLGWTGQDVRGRDKCNPTNAPTMAPIVQKAAAVVASLVATKATTNATPPPAAPPMVMVAGTFPQGEPSFDIAKETFRLARYGSRWILN